MTTKLAEFEELVLMSIESLGGDAYGVPIRRRIEDAGRSVSVGGLYLTLERLSEKGFVTSWEGGATQERGGRAKKYYKLTGEGRRALDDAEATRARVRGGVVGGLVPQMQGGIG